MPEQFAPARNNRPFTPWFAARVFFQHFQKSNVTSVEVSAVRNTDGDHVETCADKEADFFSVYLRVMDSNGDKFAQCVADVPDRATADAYAATLGYMFRTTIEAEHLAQIARFTAQD